MPTSFADGFVGRIVTSKPWYFLFTLILIVYEGGLLTEKGTKATTDKQYESN